MAVGIVVSDRASVSCYRPSIKAVRYLLQFCRSFEVKFWFPQFGEQGPLWGVGLFLSFQTKFIGQT